MTDLVVPRIILGEEPAGSRKFIAGFSETAYHSDREAVSQGALIEIDRSPAHFITKWQEPYRSEYPSPDAWTGTLVHRAVLEPDRYAKRVVRPHFGDGRTKEGKAAKQAWFDTLDPAVVERDEDGKATGLKDGHGLLIVTPEEQQQVEGMALSLLSHPLLRKYLAEAITEATVFWADDDTRVFCRARLDAVSSYGGKIAIDIKTCGSAEKEEFARTINNGGYHFQGSHYIAAGNAVEPGAFDRYVFGVVERDPPFASRVWLLSDRALAKGAAQRARCLTTLRRCIETKTWPGYPETVDVIDLPPWAYNAPTEVDF